MPHRASRREGEDLRFAASGGRGSIRGVAATSAVRRIGARNVPRRAAAPFLRPLGGGRRIRKIDKIGAAAPILTTLPGGREMVEMVMTGGAGWSRWSRWSRWEGRGVVEMVWMVEMGGRRVVEMV